MSARAELAALRRERDDLRLMLQHLMHGDGCISTESRDGESYEGMPHKAGSHWIAGPLDPDTGEFRWKVNVQDDGTGLPVLTDEARAALRGEKGGERG